MPSFNRVQLMGNLTSDVSIKYTSGGSGVGEFGIAVNEKYKKNDELVDSVVFCQVTVWGKLAEICGEYLKKGSPVFIEGKLKFDSWEKDGQKRSKLSVTATNVQFLSGKPQEAESEIPF